jgi:hypothetical protein
MLELSAEQRSLGAVWKRPSELMGLVLKNNIKNPAVGSGPIRPAGAAVHEDIEPFAGNMDGSGSLEDELAEPSLDTRIAAPMASSGGTMLSKPIVMVRKVDPLAVTQDLVSDCSFVCSLCIAAAYELNFKRQLITKIIYPQNASGMPIYNAYGKYMVKLFLNGTFRKVIVDDYLPVDPSNRLLCSSGQVTATSMELWVSIIEKAYMKVNRGYDFPGSNSGIDMFALTGWIPEQVFFAEDRGGVQSPSTDGSKRPAVLDHRQSEDRYSITMYMMGIFIPFEPPCVNA